MSPSGTEIVTQESESRQGAAIVMQQPQSTSIASAQAQAIAEVHALMSFAAMHPRNLEQMRQNLLSECRNPSFAERAIYELPFGGKPVRGPTIRFAEGAMRHLENVEITTTLVSSAPATPRSPGSETWRATMTDYQTRKRWSDEVTVERSVERHNAAGRHVYGVRTNSQGETVSVVEPTDAEFLAKKNSAKSKACRNLILRWIGPDLQDECASVVRETCERDAADNLETRRREMIDAFATIGVPVSELERYARQPLSSLSPKQVVDLRMIFVGIRDGVGTWAEVLDEAGLRDDPDATDGAEKKREGMTLVEKMRARQGVAAPQPSGETRKEMQLPTQEATREATVPAQAEVVRGAATKKRRELIAEINLLLKAGHKADVDAAVAKVGKTIAKMTDDELERVVLEASK